MMQVRANFTSLFDVMASLSSIGNVTKRCGVVVVEAGPVKKRNHKPPISASDFRKHWPVKLACLAALAPTVPSSASQNVPEHARHTRGQGGRWEEVEERCRGLESD